MSHLTLARIEVWAVAQIDGLAARPPPLATKGEGLNVKYPDVLALCQYVDAGRVDFLRLTTQIRSGISHLDGSLPEPRPGRLISSTFVD
jgi:hypothetical protein